MLITYLVNAILLVIYDTKISSNCLNSVIWNFHILDWVPLTKENKSFVRTCINVMENVLVIVGAYGTIRIVIFGNSKISLITFLNSTTQLF